MRFGASWWFEAHAGTRECFGWMWKADGECLSVCCHEFIVFIPNHDSRLFPRGVFRFVNERSSLLLRVPRRYCTLACSFSKLAPIPSS